jgi:hypothetical protein
VCTRSTSAVPESPVLNSFVPTIAEDEASRGLNSPSSLVDASLLPPQASSTPTTAPIFVDLCPCTRSQSDIFHEHTEGTVACLAVCLAHATADPTGKPRSFKDTMSIPHWSATME